MSTSVLPQFGEDETLEGQQGLGPRDAQQHPDGAPVEEGGLGRALFAARLLNRIQGASAGACSDFVHGAVAMGDLASFRSALKEHEIASGRVALGGGGALAGAYRHLLEQESWVDELQERREPLGALGSWSLYAAVTDGAPSEAPRNRE